MSYQKVILVGTVVHTPQYRQKRENVEQATRLQLMTERPTANGGTEREHHIVLIYGPLADVAHQYVHKGNQVHVEGWLRTRKYLARDGNEKKLTEIIAGMLDFKGTNDEGNYQESQEAA